MKNILFFSLMLTLTNCVIADQEVVPADSPYKEIFSRFEKFRAQWNGKNRPAFDFTAYDANGTALKLSDYRGKTVILDWWLTTCHACIEGFSHMQEIAAKYASQDVVVIAACLPEDRDDFEEFVADNEDMYPNLIWVQDQSAEISDDGVALKEYGILGAPTQFLISPEGRVIATTNFYHELIPALTQAGINVAKQDKVKAKVEKEEYEERIRKMIKGE